MRDLTPAEIEKINGIIGKAVAPHKRPPLAGYFPDMTRISKDGFLRFRTNAGTDGAQAAITALRDEGFNTHNDDDWGTNEVGYKGGIDALPQDCYLIITDIDAPLFAPDDTSSHEE